MRPFRWDVRKREQLGKLAKGELADSYDGFLDELRSCTAKALCRAGDSNLFFIGRSPESLFDYLSGILDQTSWASRLTLVNFSMKQRDWDTPHRPKEAEWQAFRDHLSQQGLSPESIASGERDTAFIDIVWSGETIERLVNELSFWAREGGVDVAAVRRRLRIVGLTRQETPGPKAYRWKRHAKWLDEFPRIPAKNVSAPGSLWDYIGHAQAKVARTHPYWRWADPSVAEPPRDEKHLAALRLGLYLFEAGLTRQEKKLFVAELTQQHEVRYRWFRSLISELRAQAI